MHKLAIQTCYTNLLYKLAVQQVCCVLFFKNKNKFINVKMGTSSGIILNPIVNIIPVDKNIKYFYKTKYNVTFVSNSNNTRYAIYVKNPNTFCYYIKTIIDGNNISKNICRPRSKTHILWHSDSGYQFFCSTHAVLVKSPRYNATPTALVKPNASNIYTNLTGAAGNIYTNLTSAAGNIYTNLTSVAGDIYTNLTSATHAACGSVEAGNIYTNLTSTTHAAGGTIKVIVYPCIILEKIVKPKFVILQQPFTTSRMSWNDKCFNIVNKLFQKNSVKNNFHTEYLNLPNPYTLDKFKIKQIGANYKTFNFKFC